MLLRYNGKGMKLHLFLDESGTSDLTNIDPNFPILALTGVLITEDAYITLKERVNDLKTKYFPHKQVVLHRRDMRKYERGFEIFFDDNVKRNFYNDLNRILTEADYVLISSAIDKRRHIEQYGKLADDPYEIALTFIMERALYEADERDATNAHVYIESRGKREDKVITSRYNQILYRGSQIDAARFQRLFDTEASLRRKTDDEIGIEIADLCAYPIARYILNNSEPNQAFDVIKPKIRANARGEMIGYGIKVFPR